MKKLYALLLLPLWLTAQVGFQQKQKNKAATPIKEKTLSVVDGEKNAAQLRLVSDNQISLEPLKRKVVRDENGNVVFIESYLKNGLTKNARKGLLTESYEFLGEVKEVLKIQNPAKEFELIDQQTDEHGQNHLKFRQTYQGLPVYGGEIILHEADDQIKFMNGRNRQSPQLKDITADIDATAAKTIALADVKQKSILQLDPLSKSIIKSQEQPAELIVYYDKNQHEFLAWQLTIKPNVLERWVYFVDANTGKILDKYNHTCSLDGTIKASARDLNGITQAFSVYQAGSQYVMVDTERSMFKKAQSVLPDDPIGVIWTIDAGNTAGSKFAHVSSTNANTWNATAVSAHINGGLAYEYYKQKHGRNSLNNKGGNIVSVINITEDDGKGMDNAYWNGEFMGYGNGRSAFKPLAGSLDVAGHEMTHGVVENTAKLEYRTQSGAINESMADCFGVLIENSNLAAGQAINWTLGESVVKATAFPSGALRSLSNPNQGGTRDPGYQPKTMGQYVYLNETPDEDNGGVHVNSGIPNHAFYLFASNANVGLDNAGKVYYKALTTYLTRLSQFVDLRLAVVQAAKDVFPGNTAIEAAAKAAFDQVGIKDGNTGGGNTPAPSTSTPEVKVNPGTEFLSVFEPSTKQLYNGPAATQDFVVISKSGLKSKPSITDDGSALYFVGADKNIYAVANPTTASRKESKLTTGAEWDNVAVSKDGKRLAALREAEDKTMYIFDLSSTSPTAKPFKLYNPTYSGVQTGEVVYADSFEWDYSGENVVYDAYNLVKSTTGTTDINYWDVGSIKVWDAAKNTFGPGTIQKLFSNLEEGDNIGNPSFSKTAPNILVFDYFNSKSTDKLFKILGVNIDNNAVVEIATTNVVGFPNYQKDDKKVTFDTKNGTSLDVAVVSLKADKISPATTKNTLYTDANWAVWFAFGQRQLPTKANQAITAFAIADQKKGAKITLSTTATSKLPVQYTIVSGDATIDGNILTCGNTAGKVIVKAYQTGSTEFNAAPAIEVAFNILNEGGTAKKDQTISALAIADQKKGAKVTLAATSSSGLAIAYSIVSGDASISGSTLTCGNTAGKVTVRAIQDGDANFNAATAVETSFNIINEAAVKQSQTITAPTIPNKYPGETLIMNFSATSKLDVAVAVISGDATVKDGVLACGSKLGPVTLRFSQAGNADFNAATSVDVSFNIIARPNVLSINPENEMVVMYPNPTEDFVVIKEENGLKVSKLTLFSSNGNILKTTITNDVISLKDLPSGQYLLQAETNKGIISKKIIRQ